MKRVKPTCGRGWWTSTLGWAWDLPDRCRLRQKNFRKEFPWRLKIWILIPLNHQCLNTLESADIMPWGTHSLIYFYFIKKIYWGIGDWPTCQFRRHKRCGFNSWVRKIPWRRKQQPSPVFLPGNPMDRGAWRATVRGVTNSRIRLKQLSSCLTCWTVNDLQGPLWLEKGFMFFSAPSRTKLLVSDSWSMCPCHRGASEERGMNRNPGLGS